MPNPIIEEARRAVEDGREPTARVLLRDLVQREPRNVEAWFMLGQLLDAPDAEQCFQRILHLDPEHALARERLQRRQTRRARQAQTEHELRRIARRPQRQRTLAVLIVGALLLAFTVTNLVVAAPGQPSLLTRIVAAVSPTSTLTNHLSQPALAAPTSSSADKIPYQAELIALAQSAAAQGPEGAPARPGDPIPVSAEAAQEFREALKSAAGSAQASGHATVTITEAHITSWLAEQVQSRPDLPVRDVQVYLRDGRAQIFGTLIGQDTTTTALAIASFSLSAEGQPNLIIEQATFGRVSVPGLILSGLNSLLNRRLVAEINEQAPGLRVTSLAINDGQAVLSGQFNP